MSLKYLFKSFYFSKIEGSYADYGAWSESISGAGGLPSEESVELFLDFLRNNGIKIFDSKIRVPQLHYYYLFEKYSNMYKNSAKYNDFKDFDGYILTHFENEIELDEILSNVKKGKKLIFLIYSSQFLFVKIEKFYEINKKLFKILGFNQVELDNFQKVYKVKDMKDSNNFESFSYGLGKILIINGSEICDSNLDDWIYLNDNMKHPKKEYPNSLLKSIMKMLNSYSTPYIIINKISKLPENWLVDQNFMISIKFKNIGKLAHSIVVKLKLNAEHIIPQFSTELYFNLLEENEEKEITFLLKTLKPGNYKKYITFYLSYKDERNEFKKIIPVNTETNFLLPNVLIKENESVLNLKAVIVKFQQLTEKYRKLEDFKEIIETIQINPNGTISTARTLLESFINKIYLTYLGEYNSRIDFDTKIRKLKSNNIINTKLNGWINTIRILANMIIHPRGDIIIKASEEDALIIVNILLNVLNEFFDLKLI